jgi:hypothetical protein
MGQSFPLENCRRNGARRAAVRSLTSCRESRDAQAAPVARRIGLVGERCLSGIQILIFSTSPGVMSSVRRQVANSRLRVLLLVMAYSYEPLHFWWAPSVEAHN